MQLKLGFIPADNQLKVMTLDFVNQQLSQENLETNQLKQVELNLLVHRETYPAQAESLSKYYPTTTYEQLEKIGKDSNLIEFDNLANIYQTVSSRWMMKNNLDSIENMVPTSSYLKNLWLSDRNQFFEELWYYIKTNLNCSELSLVFHDLKPSQAKDEEKEVKPELCYSVVKGNNLPNLQPASNIEETLMKNYQKDFISNCHITEYSFEKRQLVITAQIDLSPILMFARLPELTPLHQSLLQGLFKGLQKS